MKSFSFPTKLYLAITYVAGIAIFISRIGNVDLSHIWLLAFLCVLASLTLILKVEGSTNRSHYTFSFLVYGCTFAMFGTTEAIVVIAVSNLVEWIWNRPPWFIQLFNTGSYIVVMEAAGLVYSWINPANSAATWQAALAIILSMATFDILNHLMVGSVVWLARGENFKKSGIFEFFPLMLDLTLLYFGASLSIVWKYNVFALGLFLIPLYLVYSTLRVPALERQTETDSKTGLFNNEYFRKQLTNELARANRFDRPMSIIFADLDLLRNINNTYGHLAGDEVLIGAAKVMKDSVREYDIVSRFGGEEFSILMPETPLAQAYERAEVIRKAIENTEFTVPTSITPIRVTMSFGIAHRENFNQIAEEILHHADLALYHAKLVGRNRSCAYTNDAYAEFLVSNVDTSSSLKPVDELPKEAIESVAQKTHPDETFERAVAEIGDFVVKAGSAEAPKIKGKNHGSKHATDIFIGTLALVSLLSFVAILHWIPLRIDKAPFDWLGLMVISGLIVMSEAFSIDLYVRQASVSTSAVPILAAYLIYGPTGVIWASLVLATSLLIKYRSPFSRFVFNFSNHMLAGTLSLGLVLLVGGNFLGMAPLYQILITLASTAILYLFTSWMVAYGMSFTLDQTTPQIWSEQFRWLAPYYLGIGFIAYALIFGYQFDYVIGVLLMVFPIFLLRISQKQYIDRTRQVVTELREKNQVLKNNSEEIVELNEGLLMTLSEMIDLRDPHVLGHSKQVSKYATAIAKLLGLKEKQIDLIRRASLLHDIGKLGIAEEILAKPAQLTPEEFASIKKHAALGGDLLENSPSLRPLIPIIQHHHEFYNGKGYPDKLAGNQILIEARIVAVADAIDAMTSDRTYRKAFKRDQVIKELNRCAGSQFDPLVVKAAIQMLEAAVNEGPLPTQTSRDIRPATRLKVDVKPP